MSASKRGFFIPVNDVPNLEELLGNAPIEVPQRVTESSGGAVEAVPAQDPTVTKQYQISQIDFVWGFLFFDFAEIYSEGNKIYFNGEVSKDSVNILKRTINAVGKETLMRYHELGIHKPNEMKIELHINSPGGCIAAGWDLIDFMNNFYMPIHTVGTGTVAYMGVMLLLAGSKRYITKNTHVLIHQFRAGLQGKRQDLLDYMKHFDDMQKQIITYFVVHTNLSESKITELLQYETWMNAEVALSNGIIDGVY